MKNVTDKDIKKELVKQQVPEAMPEKEEFWQEFRDKARNIPQDAPDKSGLIHFKDNRILKVAACFLVVAIVISIYTIYNNSVNNHKINLVDSTIEDYEIFARNNGVMIMKDQQTRGTIFWVIDANTTNKKDKS